MWKKNTLRNYEFILSNFQNYFGDIELSSITSEDILGFMSKVSDWTKQNTKKLRFTLLSAFFNFIKNSVEPDFQNPCDNPALRKLFRAGKTAQFKIIEKDVIDEIIFRTPNPRNRLILELMARACMRVGEVLKLTPRDIEDRKAIIRDPKSGKEAEVAFLPQKVADRLQKYISDDGIRSDDDRIFPITYAAARIVVKKGRRSGRNSFKTTWFTQACCHICQSIRHANWNRLEDTVTSFEPVNHSDLFGKDQRRRGDKVDRQPSWIM